MTRHFEPYVHAALFMAAILGGLHHHYCRI
jgi:hypothetical protein